jgi:flagellar capping protein FliD
MRITTQMVNESARKAGLPVNNIYGESKEGLVSIGIAADRNGYLSLDESKFDAADIDTLENVLGGDSTFTVKTGYIASRIANHAESYLESSTVRTCY